MRIELTPAQIDDMLDFINGTDLDFYEEFILELTDEEQREFFADNPEFMSQYPITRDRIDLLKDSCYRGILRKIKGEEGGK